MFQGSLYLCHLGAKDGAVVSTNQGCPSVHGPLATFAGYVGLLWVKGLSTEVAGWLECPASVLIYIINIKGECKLCL